jgi:hypothetical protein
MAVIGQLHATVENISPTIRGARSRDRTIYLQIITFYRADAIRALPRIARDR